MTVNVSKPAINVREKLAELDKPTGIAGEAMLRAETPQEQQALIGVGRRNMIINGAMEVNQRNSTSITATDFLSDRWYVNFSGATGTASVEDFANGSEIGTIKKYLKFDVTTGNDNAGISQRVEGVRNVQGDVTVSFWAKGINLSNGSFYLHWSQHFGSGGSARVDISSPIEFVLGSDWKYYSVTFSVPSVAGKTIGAGDNFQLVFSQYTNTSTAAWELNITGVQLELGKVATPFEHRSYGEELALCQRYYYRITSDGTNQNIFGVGLVDGSADAYTQIYLPVTMRTAPTSLDVTGTASDYGVRMGSGTAVVSDTVPLLSSDTQPDIGIVLFSVATGLTANSACFGRAMTSGTYLGFYAEL